MYFLERGKYLYQFLVREVTNDLFERLYTDLGDFNGNDNYIGEEVIIEGNVSLGKHSVVSERSVLNGEIDIGKNTFIGQNVTVFGKIRIGSNVYIESGSVVTKNIPSNTYYCGIKEQKKISKNFLPSLYSVIREPQKKPTKNIVEYFKHTCDIGENVKFGKQVHIEGGANVSIGSGSIIGNRVIMLSTQHPHHEREDLIETAQHWHDIKLGKNVVVEDNVIIRGGVEIGDNSRVKAGSVITKSISSNVVAEGCPARPNLGISNPVSIKFPSISNYWAIIGHMYPSISYFNSFDSINLSKEVLINNELMVVGKQNVSVGHRSLIGPRVTLVTESPLKKGEIQVGNNCFIGGGAVILPGVKISDGAIIGAGSVVTKNVKKNEIWVGKNAKKISNRTY